MARPRIQAARPFKQYILKKVKVTHDHDRELRLIIAALENKGTKLDFSQLLELVIDEFLEKLGTKKEDKG